MRIFVECLRFLLPIQDWSSTDGLVDGGDFRLRSSNQAGAGVSDRLASTNAERLVVDLHSVHLELPVSLAVDRQVGEVAGVVIRVGSTEDDFTAAGCRRVAVQVEREDRLWHQSLVEHVVERRFDAIDGNRFVAKSENSVARGKEIDEMRGNIQADHDDLQFSGDENQARFRDCLSERLFLDVQAANLQNEG
jgi:hypothetical protein